MITSSLAEFSSSIIYNEKEINTQKSISLENTQLRHSGKTHWLNIYGLDSSDEIRNFLQANDLDEFIYKLLLDKERTTKVLILNEVVFIAIRVLKTENNLFESEQMFFMVDPAFLWSIQEKKGDYFEWVRERLQLGKGIVRKRKVDYLLYLLLESIIDNYHETYQKYTASYTNIRTTEIKPTPEFTAKVERRKQDLFKFKRATASLRDTFTKLEQLEIKELRSKYFSELKDQANNLISDIDFDLHELESDINLIFSIQGHRLNDVMKTLTIFSVIFIPLTFIAGIYGMNFDHIPGAKHPQGFHILMIIMALISGFSIFYFIRKKWF